MSPKKPIAATSGVYTVVLALTLMAVVFAAMYVVYRCHADYDTIFKIAG